MRRHFRIVIAAGVLAFAAGSIARAGPPVAVTRPGATLSAPRVLPRPDSPEMKAVSALIAQRRPYTEVRARWQAAVAGASAREADVEQLVQAVLEQAQQIQQADLAAAQAEVARTNQEKARLRQQVQTLKARQQEAEVKKWEEKLNSLGDDAQLANVDLQNILQKQQQTLQMLSNISKMLFDTAMSVIKKIGG